MAPPGAGKTALVASWLRSRKLPHLWVQLDEADGDVATFFHHLALGAGRLAARPGGLPAFTPEFLSAPGGFARLLFRALCTGPRPPAIIVLDDYHEVRSDSPLHAALRDGLWELAPGVTTIVMSRSEPPAALARLRANELLEVIRADELYLTVRETRDIAGLWGYSGRDRDMLLALHSRTAGWAAGLVLLLAGWRSGTLKQRRGDQEQTLSDYFAQEVLERSDPETQRVLVETALLPRVEGPTAVRLTGVERAEEILAGFSRRGCFVVRHDTAYQYHALFREFLLGQGAKTLSPDRRAAIQRSAARLFEESNQTEEAFHAYVQARAWVEAARIIRARAPFLMHQGRAETLARWVERVPGEVRDRDPWLLLHLGEALSVLDPRAALGPLERAFDLFRATDDGPGACLAWATISETHVFALQDHAPLDHWLSELEGLHARHPDGGSPEIEARLVAAAFVALTHRQPWHLALPSWEERALTLALSPGDAYTRMKVGRALLLCYGGLTLDLTRATLVADALRPLAIAQEADPATTIFWHLGDAVLQLHLGRVDACLEAVTRGLALSSESDLHAWDVVFLQVRFFAALQGGDLVSAERVLREMAGLRGPATALGPTLYHHGAVLLARRRGNVPLAREHARTCREFLATIGSPQIDLLYGTTCALVGPPESIQEEMEKLLVLARRCGSRLVQATSLLVLALAAVRRGDEDRAVTLLHDGFAIARELGGFFFFHLEPAELSDCCALALEHGIEPEYVRELIRTLRLRPGERASVVEAWPWELRIKALGDFAVMRNGERMQPGRKAPKKPLEMLRLLVAQGPRGARQDLLAEALWPDAEGDAASHALKTTVYRLRRLLGKTEVVVHREGRVTLDPRLVFVDAWALEWLLDRIDAKRTNRAGGPTGLDGLRARVKSLYRGELFGLGGDDPIIAAAAERLRGLVQRHFPGAVLQRASAAGDDRKVAGAGDPVVIGMTFNGLWHPLNLALKNAAEQAAAKLDAELVSEDSRASQLAQADDIDGFVARGVRGIVVSPVGGLVVPAIERAVNAGIAVATVDNQAATDKVLVHVGTDNVEVGRAAARFVIEKLGNRGSVIEIEGTPGWDVAAGRKAGFDEVMGKSNVRILVSRSGYFDRGMAKTLFGDLIQIHSGFDAVFAANDEMIIGAIDAIGQAEIDPASKVTVGVDATPVAFEYMRAGKLSATIEQFPGKQVRQAVEYLVDYIKHKTKPPRQVVLIKPELITKAP